MLRIIRYEKLGNKEFWETIRPFLSNKNTVFSQISIEKKYNYI